MAINRKTRSVKTNLVGCWIAVIFAIICALSAMVWVRFEHIRVGYDVTAALNQQRDLLSKQNYLKVEVSHLKSTDRIAQIATGQLGLIKPTLNQTVAMP
jgi:cell division protein FtsL